MRRSARPFLSGVPTDGPALPRSRPGAGDTGACRAGRPASDASSRWRRLRRHRLQHRLLCLDRAADGRTSRDFAGRALRLFSKQALADLAKDLVKLSCSARSGRPDVAAAFRLRRQRTDVRRCSVVHSLAGAKSIGGHGDARRGCGGRLPVPGPRWYARQGMSLQEIEEEFRQTEGDPAIKDKMKQFRNSEGRMMQRVRKPRLS